MILAERKEERAVVGNRERQREERGREKKELYSQLGTGRKKCAASRAKMPRD